MSDTPVIGVLALQGDVREHIAAVSSCGLRAVPVRRSSELDAVDALMGTKPEARFRFIQERAEFAETEELDI